MTQLICEIMEKFHKRQLDILEFIRKKGAAGNKDIKDYLEQNFDRISRVTVVRDINALLRAGIIAQEGKGRSIKYKEAAKSNVLRYIDIDEYFKNPPDKREILFERFNFEIFKNFKDILRNIFPKEELKELNELNNNYRKRVKELPPAILKKEFERLTIELSWKSSQIEGNTYSLLDTEILIKEHKEAEGHKKEEATMILNHKKTLDYILAEKSDFKNIAFKKLENIQKLIVEDLNISTGLRQKPVGIVGTRYKPLDNQYQIKEAMESSVKLINKADNPFTKSLLTILLISYIQPFEDGNKRTARLLGDAVLLAHDVCPLSFRSIEESDYKKAVIVFFEQNNIRFFKKLFVEQFKFAVQNYFL